MEPAGHTDRRTAWTAEFFASTKSIRLCDRMVLISRNQDESACSGYGILRLGGYSQCGQHRQVVENAIGELTQPVVVQCPENTRRTRRKRGDRGGGGRERQRQRKLSDQRVHVAEVAKVVYTLKRKSLDMCRRVHVAAIMVVCQCPAVLQSRSIERGDLVAQDKDSRSQQWVLSVQTTLRTIVENLADGGVVTTTATSVGILNPAGLT